MVHFQIRMPPQQHEKLATWAKEDKVSLNLLVVGILEKAMERRKAEPTAAKAGSDSPPSEVTGPDHVLIAGRRPRAAESGTSASRTRPIGVRDALLAHQ